MLDLDAFLTDCREAAYGDDALLAVRDVLARAMDRPGAVAEALPVTRPELVPLYVDERVTVLKAVWAPGMKIRPHNHLMWAAIALYGGQEDNTFYRRGEHGLTVSGGRTISTRDVALLGDDTIHAVANPGSGLAAAVHVYGGDLTHKLGRSEWDEAQREVPFDFAGTLRYFAEANEALERASC